MTLSPLSRLVPPLVWFLAHAFLLLSPSPPLHINTRQNLCGRVLKGRTDADFRTLSNDPRRRIVMVIGEDGLERISGKSGYEILTLLGYEPNYTRHLIASGFRFKLALFEKEKEAMLATWENVAAITRSVYPDVAEAVIRNLPDLQRLSFAEIERRAGFDFSEVEKKGVEDSRYMTVQRYKTSSCGSVETRAFLYFSLHLKELFAGDGFTYDAEHRRGLREYFMVNKRIEDIPTCRLVDFDVEVQD